MKQLSSILNQATVFGLVLFLSTPLQADKNIIASSAVPKSGSDNNTQIDLKTQVTVVPSFIGRINTRFAQPFCVSNTGWVAGASKRGTDCAHKFGGAGSGRSYPFVSNGRLGTFLPGCETVVLADNTTYSVATSVNDSGWTVGTNSSSSGYRFKDSERSNSRRAFLSRGDTVVFVGTFDSAAITVFQDINNSGQIAGSITGTN